MAAKELTPRQQEIKGLLEKGKKPKEIAKKLKITENAVYQQIRRIRNGGASGRSQGGTPRRVTTQRQSSRTRQRPSRPAPAPKPQTAEELLRSEIVAANEAKTELSASIESLKGEIAQAEGQITALDAEIATKGDVLAVLTGEKVAHAKPAPPKPRPARQQGAKANGKGGSGAQGGSQTPSGDGGAPAEPKSQAEREATAEHDGQPGEKQEAEAAQQAAEQPQA